MPQNIELKVSCTPDELAAVRELLATRSTSPPRTFRQIDIYFRVAAGRLKLRTIESEGVITAVELIQYQRVDVAGPRTSSYRRIPIPLESALEIDLALREALCVSSVVRKERTVAIWQSTRIHLDMVEGLGAFVELETMLSEHLSAEAGQAEYANVVEWLGLANLKSIPGSYSDLLVAQVHPSVAPK